jgi:lambda repressor-like predicted transcriptional regulator
MIRIYSHDNVFIVHNLRNILENAGIRCVLKNEQTYSAAGELPPTEVWPEIWIDPKSEQEALELIELAIKGDPSKTHWVCPKCDESNPPAFDLCWQCETERPVA